MLPKPRGQDERRCGAAGRQKGARHEEEAQRTLNKARPRLIRGSDTSGLTGTRDLQGPTCHNSAFQLASTWHTAKLHSYFSFSLHTKFDILIGCFNLKNSSEGLISPWQPGSPSKRKPSAQHRCLFRLTWHRAEEVWDLVWGGQLHALRERWGAALPSWKTGPPFQSPLFPCK